LFGWLLRKRHASHIWIRRFGGMQAAADQGRRDGYSTPYSTVEVHASITSMIAEKIPNSKKVMSKWQGNLKLHEHKVDTRRLFTEEKKTRAIRQAKNQQKKLPIVQPSGPRGYPTGPFFIAAVAISPRKKCVNPTK
jgi:hypothetical protein